jgi:membrane protein involved in colicin uptake
MKFMVGLSSCALVALSISPSLATNRAISSSTIRPLSHQSLPAGIKTIQVAESIDPANRKTAIEQMRRERIEAFQRAREKAQRAREEAQRAREEAREKARETKCFGPKSAQQERREAAREKIRQERAAEIEKQKYLKSLTPEQREEYLARQRSTPAVGASSPIKVSSPEMGKNSAASSDRDPILENRDKNSDNSSLKPQPSSAPD